MNRDKVIENYVEFIVDSMDIDTLVAFVTNSLLDRLDSMSDNDIKQALIEQDLAVEQFDT